MKQLCSLILFSIIIFSAYAQNFCSPDGDIAIFSNYDGGVLRINVDLPTPNLKIGIVSYEDDSVIISGAYAANVSRVVYAGYFNSNNVHCSPNIDVKGVYGVDTSIVDINFIPPATLSNPNGYLYIICNTSCDLSSSQGGCNTADQVEDYFFNQFGSSKLLFHRTQYGCWTGTQSLSSGGNCCALSVNVPETNALAGFSIYPNPANGVLNVDCRMKNVELEIYDVTGRKVLDKPLHFQLSTFNFQLSAGLYFVKVQSANEVYSQKLVIE